MRKEWRSLWFFVSFLPLLLVLWLAWVLPGWGFFRLEADPFFLPEEGMVLVELREGKVVSSSTLSSHGIGWHALSAR
jgi:hypothetical protein